MEVKKLYEMVDEDQKEGSLGEKAYWKDLWECYIEEKSMDYASLSVKEMDTQASPGRSMT